MYPGPFKPWLDRLLEMALGIVAIALLLNWAWQLLRPLLPVMLMLAGSCVIVTVIVRRNRSW